MKPIDMTNAYKLNFHYKNIYYYFIQNACWLLNGAIIETESFTTSLW